MAKGDKNKSDKTTELTESHRASSETADPPGVEQTEQTAAPETERSELPQEPEAPEELNVPVLSNIIVERYEGGRCGELYNGEGVAHFQGGRVYKGSFVDGLMHGYGEYTWADGVKYKGDFVSNTPTGHGTYTFLDGSTYEGEVGNGLRHGTGTYKCAKTTTLYKGTWRQGKRHGEGCIYYNKEATCWYEGDWSNNQREGWGVHRYSSGNTYEGQWRNDVRHGEGTMKWTELAQQYSGWWSNGIQDGYGTHTWFLRRVRGSQYQLRNEYKGEFIKGLRHGRGTFTYASGAVYTGGWKENKKHGRARFVFKNGLVYDGEFIDDRMAEVSPPSGVMNSVVGVSVLGPDVALSIEGLLKRFPEAQREQELKQVEFAVLRHISLLRELYGLYSRLGCDQSADRTFILSRLQLWRFLKDCGIHQHGISLAQMDRLIDEDSPEELHSPFSTVSLRNWISYIIGAAYHIYHKDFESSRGVLDKCFSELMKHDVVKPDAKNVKGLLFCHPGRAVVGMTYAERCLEIYQACSKHNPTATMKARGFVWLFKDLGLFDVNLSTARVLEILSLENPAIHNPTYTNLDWEITFLEFFEALLGCAEAKTGGTAAASTTTAESVTSKPTETDPGPKDLIIDPESKHKMELKKDQVTEQPSINTESAGGLGPEGTLDIWTLAVHQFFLHALFPAYERNLLLKKEAERRLVALEKPEPRTGQRLTGAKGEEEEILV